MVETATLLQQLPAYAGNKKKLLDNQTADDIIAEMIKAHKLHSNDYDKIASYFWKGNLKDTGQYIFDFLKKNVRYSIEPDVRQSIKSPASILATGYYKDGYNDCKHYSQFISGILDSLKRSGKNLDWCYRFANYRWYTDEPQHVFVVASDGKNEYWIDPVLRSFNERKPFINKLDKKISMSLYQISGVSAVGNAGVACLQPIAGGAGIGKRNKAAKAAKRTARKAKRKAKGGLFKRITKGFKKVAMAPSRAAFFAILKINPFKMATNLNASLDNPAKRAKMQKKWEKIGGNFKKLESAVRKQYAHFKKRKGIQGIGYVQMNGIGYVQIEGIGFVHHIVARKLHKKFKARRRANVLRKRRNMPPLRAIPLDSAKFTPAVMSGIENAEIGAVQLVALLAAAAPIIAILAEFLPKMMKDKSAKAAEEIPADTQQAALTAAANSDPEIRQEQNYNRGGGGSDLAEQSAQTDDDTDTSTKSKAGFGIDSKTLMIGGAAIAAAILLSRKK